MSAPDEDDYIDDPTRGWRMDEDEPGEFASHSDVEIDDFEPGDYCATCENEGQLLVCPDDMCRGVGECLHGDGYIVCPRCGVGSFL